MSTRQLVGRNVATAARFTSHQWLKFISLFKPHHYAELGIQRSIGIIQGILFYISLGLYLLFLVLRVLWIHVINFEGKYNAALKGNINAIFRKYAHAGHHSYVQ
jgi:hypothetical protein